MKQNFAARYADMSDEQLEYEASQSDGFAIDAREAMRAEFEKRGLAYSDELSAKRDGVQSGDGQHAHAPGNSDSSSQIRQSKFHESLLV